MITEIKYETLENTFDNFASQAYSAASDVVFKLNDYVTTDRVLARGRKFRGLFSTILGGYGGYAGYAFAIAGFGASWPAALAYGVFNGIVWSGFTYGVSMATTEISIKRQISRLSKLKDSLKKK
jgi:hypothetical protein